MQLLDVNVLVYSFRKDGPEYGRYASWMRQLVDAVFDFFLNLVLDLGKERLQPRMRPTDRDRAGRWPALELGLHVPRHFDKNHAERLRRSLVKGLD